MILFKRLFVVYVLLSGMQHNAHAIDCIKSPSAEALKNNLKALPSHLDKLLGKVENNKLFHQVEYHHSQKLEKSIGRSFQDIPQDWVSLGALGGIWTKMGEAYFVDGYHPLNVRSMGLYLLRPKKGWRFILRQNDELKDIARDLEGQPSALESFWLEHFDGYEKLKKVPNKFDDEQLNLLRQYDLPEHSSFWEDLKIAGYHIYDFGDVYIFPHPLGGEVKLQRKSKWQY